MYVTRFLADSVDTIVNGISPKFVANYLGNLSNNFPAN